MSFWERRRMLNEEIAKFLGPGSDAHPIFDASGISAMREGMRMAGAALPAPTLEIQDHEANGVPVRLYKPHGMQHVPTPLLVFLHGGGWMLGDIESHDAPCRVLADRAQCAVLAVGYRLAPEHPFPAALDDCANAFEWALANAGSLGCDADRIALGGESAGANLCAALTIRFRDRAQDQPAFQFLVHPATDLLLGQSSIDDVSLPGMTRSYLEACVRIYAGDQDASHPWISPMRCPDLSNLPRSVIYTVEVDPLRDDGENYALALARAGTEVLIQRLPGLPHGFMVLPTSLQAVDRAFDQLAQCLKSYFGDR
jgi:acetyl esterase